LPGDPALHPGYVSRRALCGKNHDPFGVIVREIRIVLFPARQARQYQALDPLLFQEFFVRPHHRRSFKDKTGNVCLSVMNYLRTVHDEKPSHPGPQAGSESLPELFPLPWSFYEQVR
jgi:hypothetical protein